MQCRAGVQSELAGEVRADAVVDVQRVACAAGAVQGEHELRAGPLARGMLVAEELELADDLLVAPEREVGVDPALERAEAQFVESLDLRPRERLERDLGKRRAAPQGERCLEGLGGACRIVRGEHRATVGHPVLERVGSELARLDRQEVATAHRPQRGLGHRTPIGERNRRRICGVKRGHIRRLW